MQGEEYLKQRGVQVVVIDHEECRELMERFIKEKPEDWYEKPSSSGRSTLTDVYRNEDIGEEQRVHSKEQKYM